uniref:Tesmin/TSO1-like CXC domain-containing protein n=1 Tax=Anoplophora glabripennis TaxID=217634 RepID=V5GUE2_ANOGL
MIPIPSSIPPAEPVLLQHVMRVKWQINEWSQARSASITSFDPTQYGWILKNNVLCYNYFEGDTAMEMLQKFICSCSGKLPCSDEDICSCLSQGFKCCDLCNCSIKCQNAEIQTDDTDSETEN